MKCAWGLAAAVAVGAANIGAMPIGLVPNRATYDLHLEHSSPGGVVAARGRLVVQFRDTCDGWSTAQRMVADLSDADGVVSRTDFLVTAWESKDGRSMRFDVKGVDEGKLAKEKRGTALMADDGTARVTLLAPARRQFTLPGGTIFPTAQIVALLDAALRGRGTLRRLVFQGGDEGDFFLSTAVVGRKAPVQSTSTERAVDKNGLLKNVPAWTVLISYFPSKRSAETPDYEVASRLYANGIVGAMSLIYSHYTLRATLARLEPLPPAC